MRRRCTSTASTAVWTWSAAGRRACWGATGPLPRWGRGHRLGGGGVGGGDQDHCRSGVAQGVGVYGWRQKGRVGAGAKHRGGHLGWRRECRAPCSCGWGVELYGGAGGGVGWDCIPAWKGRTASGLMGRGAYQE